MQKNGQRSKIIEFFGKVETATANDVADYLNSIGYNTRAKTVQGEVAELARNEVLVNVGRTKGERNWRAVYKLRPNENRGLWVLSIPFSSAKGWHGVHHA